MRNMKKFLALVLAMVMVLSMAVITTSAADDADYTEAALQLNALKVMVGDEKGDLMLDKGVTRYQTALFFARALTGTVDTAVWNAVKTSANFKDVTEYGSAIDYAYGVNVVRGRGNGEFGFNDPIIYQDMVVMAVRALGYETADMVYPYGHILAAQKLELLEGIDNVNYKAEFTRGETAQLIWNMLGTEVAAVDPLTDKVLYPGDYGLSGALNDDLKAELLDRETLLEKSGLAGGNFDAVIAEFTPADEDDEESVDMITLVTADNEFEVAAADLGITADTAKVTYLGLPVEVFFNVDEGQEFDQEKYDDGDANIVLANIQELTTVSNIGEENIKLVVGDKSYVELDGTKYYEDKYEGRLYLWDDEEGWVESEDWDTLKAAFLWTKKDGYNCKLPNGSDKPANLSTYVTVDYYVEEVEGDRGNVHMYLTEYEFGQYIERELTYAVTSKAANFTLIGTFGASTMDGETTKITEKFVGSNTTLTDTKKSVKKTAGELASEVTVTGVEVKSGDFMFYNYNKADNTLTVAANCGTLATGRMTATSSAKETVKIGGTNYEFGFAGLFPATTTYNNDAIKLQIAELEPGEDNVEYLAVNGKIVYWTAYAGESEDVETAFVILNTDAELIAELLGITDTKYADALIGGYEIAPAVADDPNTDEDEAKAAVVFPGVYVKDGKVVVAALDVTTGEWVLVNIAGVALNYVADEDGEYDFTTTVDVATVAKNFEITENIKNVGDYKAACALITTGFAMVVEEEDGTYTIADIDTDDNGATDGGEYLVDRYAEEKGLTFSASGISNKIKASADDDAASVTTNEKTVLVLFNTSTGEFGIRVGAQNAETKVAGTSAHPVVFLTASNDLIVMATDSVDATAWGDIQVADEDTNYFLKTADFNYELENTENEDEYSLTVTGLYDFRNLKMAEDIVVVGTKEEINALATGLTNLTNTQKIYLNKKGNLDLTKKAASFGAVLVDLLGTDYTAIAGGANYRGIVEFEDANTIKLSNNPAKATEANVDLTSDIVVSNIEITVATADLTDIDWKTLKLDTMYVAEALTDGYTEYDGVSVDNFVDTNGDEKVDENDEFYYAYEINVADEAVEITAPEAGVLDQFALDMMGKTIKVLDKEGDEFSFTVNCRAVATYDKETDTVIVTLVKYIAE